ncbi:nucleoside diphosphate kinase regulator [Cupriavidus gilardii]|uniref:nucleoside diphosphate kinase regulator n=1 Tax=Cupriavidus gilardii TaxID=82541 RepID=UPI001574B2A1|nr:nucleoside diphosphate kinase regulator [Cupriavidus gilardii]MBO4122022.1 nucleoside diphosphate kinase regulator [Cupriavidus gilardii]MCG5259143.1 nucleoside diphosphate kinase regulator [Cupriavidus gilardii]MDF9428773.1 nucleoside diphosphate kinase regulator [Cupriavidus gilardii]NSX03722.1 nucleoside diphosphate kinase regulator [Cupriavidus gilardii]
MNASASLQPTLYLTELDVTRLERIASRAPANGIAEMLDDLLARAAIVPPDAIPQDVVTMNSTVRCALEGDPAPREWTLVYPDNADFEAGRISVFSPVGQALLGARAGESVSYRLPDGREQRVTVLELSYQPEANGQFTL